MMKRILLAVAVAVIGVTAVVAQSDPIAERKALMKANGGQSRIARDMIDGKQPFDLAKAHTVLQTFAAANDKGKALWPTSSKTGETDSLPAVWENKADFDAKLAKFSRHLQELEDHLPIHANWRRGAELWVAILRVNGQVILQLLQVTTELG